MPEVDKLQLKNGSWWKPNELAFITGLLYETSSELSEGFLRITGLSQPREKLSIWPDPEKGFNFVEIDFIDIGNLKLKGFSSGKKQIMGFSIHNIKERGLDGIAYEVEDYENGIISFYCRNIIVKKHSPEK